MINRDFFELEYLRLDAYRLLADGYHRPEQSLLDNLKKLTNCMEQICSDAAQYIKKMHAAIAGKEGAGVLEVDFARLFVGPFNLLAPPYGSVYLEGERQVMGASTADVQMRYRTAGLDVDAGFKDAPDHVAAELEFMHFLIFKSLVATNQGDMNHIAACLRNQQSFLEIHLGAWVHDFASKVIENATTSFYRNLARATETFVIEDYQILTSVLTVSLPGFEKSNELEANCGQC